MALRYRIVAAVAALTVVLAVAGGTGFYLYLGRATRATLEYSLSRRAARVQAALSSNLLTLAAPGVTAHPVVDQAVVQVLGPSGVAYTTAVAGGSPLVSRSEMPRTAKAPIWLVRKEPGWANPHLVLAEAVSGKPGDVLAVGASMDQMLDSLRLAREALLGAAALAVLLSGAGAWMLAGAALRPVEALRAEADRLEPGAAAEYLPVPPTGDELAALAETLNAMMARSRAASEHQRRFLAAASHELRTPLAGMRAELDLAADGPHHGSYEGVLSRLAARVDHLGRVCEGLLIVAQGEESTLPLRKRLQPLEPIVLDALEAVGPVAARCGVDLVLDTSGEAVALVDAVRARQVLDNLLANALAHAPAHSAVTVAVHADGTGVLLEIRDEGPGFGPSMLAHAVDPFARSPEGGGRPGGCGLGLTIVELIVRAHEGTLRLSDPPGGGALVRVEWPGATSPTTTPATRRGTALAVCGRRSAPPRMAVPPGRER